MDFQNKEGYAIYREHDGDIHKIHTTANEDGEYIDVDGNFLTLHTKKFSTYALVVSASVIIDPNSCEGITDDGNTAGGSSPSTPERNSEDDSDETAGNSSDSSSNSSSSSSYTRTKYTNTLVEGVNGEISLSRGRFHRERSTI